MSTCDYEYHWESLDFKCLEPVHNREATCCMFHDINYLKEDNYEKNRGKVANRFEKKLSEYSSKRMPMKFMGYCLPDISFQNEPFNEALYFNDATFYGIANFRGAKFFNVTCFNGATFSNKAYFGHAEFFKQADFRGATFNETIFGSAKFYQGADFFTSTFLSKAHFSGEFKSPTYFNYTIFKEPSNVTFNISNMSNVSFSNCDITRIRFSDKVAWGGDDKFTVTEEKWLMEEAEQMKKNKKSEQIEKRNDKGQSVSLELVLSVYRNLRENYEFRLRYGDAGRFFKKEMELKRKYRYAPLVSAVFKRKLIKLLKKLKLVNINAPESNIEYILRKNGLLRRNLSLTGLYYHFSNYGESIARPTIIGAITVALSTLFWLTQANPSKDPSLSKFVGAYWILHMNTNYLERAFERSLADFLPVLSLPTGISQGVIDYVTKIFGGALTFGLLAIALRRKFERKYTH